MILSAIIKVLMGLFIIFWSSVFFYLSFHSFYIPTNTILREPLYFDFSKESPVAKITLLSAEKQWEYSSERMRSALASVDPSKRFLNKGSSYIISVEMVLAKSSRNKDISKFMLNMRAMDKRNEQVAVSSRPFVVPYQSRISKTLEGVILWPLRMVGLSRRSETVMVREELMNNYKEGSEPTERFEFSLSTNAADIEAVYLSIFPRLNLLT